MILMRPYTRAPNASEPCLAFHPSLSCFTWHVCGIWCLASDLAFVRFGPWHVGNTDGCICCRGPLSGYRSSSSSQGATGRRPGLNGSCLSSPTRANGRLFCAGHKSGPYGSSLGRPTSSMIRSFCCVSSKAWAVYWRALL